MTKSSVSGVCGGVVAPYVLLSQSSSVAYARRKEEDTADPSRVGRSSPARDICPLMLTERYAMRRAAETETTISYGAYRECARDKPDDRTATCLRGKVPKLVR